MTDPIPELLRPSPAQLQQAASAALFKALAEFQADSLPDQPITPRLPEVLDAAAPAFMLGIGYATSRWHDEITVTVCHEGGGEIGSSAPFTGYGTSYSATVAQLLAGLLGIPLADEAAPAAAEEPVACGLRKVTITDLQQQEAPAEPPAAKPAPEPSAVPEPVSPADEFEDEFAEEEDPARPLTPEEHSTAVAMVKSMEKEQRSAFVKAFKAAFNVPRTVTQVSAAITELQHLHFVDRFTTEAAGGVAP